MPPARGSPTLRLRFLCSFLVSRLTEPVKLVAVLSLACGYRLDTSKTEMIGPSGNFAFASCAHYIARAVLVSAQKRSAAVNFLFFVRLRGIKRRVRPLRISRHASCDCQLLVVVRAIPVTGPLPHIACHVIQAVTIRRKLRNWSNPRVPVVSGIGVGKMSLVCVGHPLSARPEFVAPRVALSRETSACRKFPLRFRGQTLPRPLGIGQGVRIGHLDDWIFFTTLEIGVRTFGVTPVRSLYEGPPFVRVVKRHGMSWRRKNVATGVQIFEKNARKLLRGRSALRDGHITFCLHESGKLFVSHISFVHPETVHVYAVDGACIGGCLHPYFIGGWWIQRPHGKFTARNPYHAVWRLRGRRNSDRNGGTESLGLSDFGHRVARLHFSG